MLPYRIFLKIPLNECQRISRYPVPERQMEFHFFDTVEILPRSEISKDLKI